MDRIPRAVASAGAIVAVLAGGLPSVGTPNPPGNNGTIKIDDVPFDDHPDNEPHVGCTFQWTSTDTTKAT